MEREFDRKNLQRPHMTNYPFRRMNDRFDTYNPARPRDLPGVAPTRAGLGYLVWLGEYILGPNSHKIHKMCPGLLILCMNPLDLGQGTPSHRSSRSTSYTPQSSSYSQN